MSSSSSSSAPPPPSYTTMDKDLDAIGAHCQAPYCNQLDFLPFRCESCKSTFCLDHRTETAHKCPRAGAWAAARRKFQTSSDSPSSTPLSSTTNKPTLATGIQCSHPSCKTYIHTLSSVGVGCPTCSREYCLKHRLKEDHACATLKPPEPNSSAQRATAALSRLRLWGKEKAVAAAASTNILKASTETLFRCRKSPSSERSETSRKRGC